MYVRYEDLVLNSKETVTNIMRFILDVPSLEGTVAEVMVDRACEGGMEKKKTY